MGQRGGKYKGEKRSDLSQYYVSYKEWCVTLEIFRAAGIKVCEINGKP
jgi:hypothetical protein